MSVELVLCRLYTWRRSWLDVLRSWRICKEMMLYIIVRRRGGCILSECQQCIVRTMKRRWGNYFLSRYKTSIRSLASSTHTHNTHCVDIEQFTFASSSYECVLIFLLRTILMLLYHRTNQINQFDCRLHFSYI